jgi:colanic acid biosynthesis glycosyl transferase WcaI
MAFATRSNGGDPQAAPRSREATAVRVVFLNQTFHPDVAATAQHAFDLARDLAAHGHEVHAIASRSLYGERGATLPAEEVVDGIQVHRVGRSLFGKAGLAARLFDFAAFFAASAWRLLRMPRADVCVCLTTPPFIALAGVLAKRLRGGRLVIWSMDLYPDAPVAFGLMRPGSLMVRMASRLDRLCLSAADAVVALGRCMRDRLIAKGVEAERIRVIGVWSDEDEVAEARGENPFRSRWDVGDRTLVMYSGNFGLGHDVETFLGAAERLRGDDRVRFAFVGGGKRKREVDDFVRERGLTNCIVEGHQPRELLGALLTAADLHLVTIRPGVEGIMVPSKFYGILAANRPAILVGAAEGEIGRTIVEERCGEIVAASEVDALAAAILRRVQDPEIAKAEGARGRAALAARFSRRHRCAEWRALLESLARRGANRASAAGDGAPKALAEEAR